MSRRFGAGRRQRICKVVRAPPPLLAAGAFRVPIFHSQVHGQEAVSVGDALATRVTRDMFQHMQVTSAGRVFAHVFARLLKIPRLLQSCKSCI